MTLAYGTDLVRIASQRRTGATKGKGGRSVRPPPRDRVRDHSSSGSSSSSSSSSSAATTSHFGTGLGSRSYRDIPLHHTRTDGPESGVCFWCVGDATRGDEHRK